MLSFFKLFISKLATNRIFHGIFFNFIGTDSTHVSNDEIEQVKRLVKFLLTRKSLLSDITIPSDDIICPICYANSLSATFHPCNHQSCISCIKQHLMNTKVCFYCKSFISKVYDFDGAVVHENPPIDVTEVTD